MMAKPICSIDGCGRPTDARGWCKRHYRRWQRHGHPLGGGVTPGTSLKWVLEVALAYEGDECLRWPFGQDGAGYGSMHIDGKHVRASRFICAKAHGEPDDPSLWVAHSCGKGHLGCVAKKHLRWATPAENTLDSIQHGTFVMGEESPRAKLAIIDIHMIRALTEKGFSQKQVSKKFGISPAQVGKIALRKKWAWLGDFEPTVPSGGFIKRAVGTPVDKAEER